MRAYPFHQLIAVALPAVLVACSGSEVTFPTDRRPAQLRSVSGGGQEGTVGSQVPKPLVVRLTDDAARAVTGIPLRFQTDAPEAQIEPAIIETDDSGFASVQVRLGTTTGTQIFEARLADDGTSDLRTTFDLTAVSPKKDGKKGDGGRGRGRGRGHDDQDDDD
jgi:hypothetical protein